MKIPAISSFILLLALAGIAFMSSCEKENTDMIALIEVRYLGDTAIVVPGAYVTLEKNDVFIDGTTNAQGVFSHTFKLEAILDVTATIDTGQYLTGNSVIRLRPGKTVTRKIYVSQ